MRFQTFIAALALMAASCFSTAQAAPITYTLSGTLSGSLELASFTDKAFSWTVTGDTTQRQTLGSGLSAVPAMTSLLDIADVGSPITPMGGEVLASSGAPLFATFAFEIGDSLDGVGFFAPELAGYDGLRSMAPIAVNFTGTFLLTTEQGMLLFETGSDMFFQAVTVPDVPEPITLTLFGAGFAGVGAMRRLQKTRA